MNPNPEFTPEVLAERLLAITEEADRRRFLRAHPSSLTYAVIEALKSRSDGLLMQDPDRALQIASLAREAAALSEDPLAEGLALWAYGNAVFFFKGDFRTALITYQEARAIYAAADCALEVARLLTNQVAVLRNLADYDEALATAAQARFYLEPLGPTRYLATLEMNVGAVQRHRGDYEQALAAYARGRTIFVALDDPVQVARMDLNRANVLENLDRFAEAEARLTQAREVLEAENATLEVARADLNLGITTYRQGRYREALRHFERARDGFDTLAEPFESATVDLYRARVYLALNLLPEAVSLAQSARQELAQQHLRRYVAACWTVEAQAQQRQGDRLAAMRALDRARRAYREIKAPVEVAVIDMRRADLLRETGEPRSGWCIAKRTAHFFAAHDLPVRQAQVHVVQARCALALDQLQWACNLAQDALAVGQSLDLADVAWRAQHIRGRVAERQGQTPVALDAYRAAIAAIEHLGAALAVDVFRAGFLADKLAVYEDAIRAALSLEQVEEAFTLTQRAVAAALLSVPDSARDPASLDEADLRLRERLERLRRTWHWQNSNLESAGWEDLPPPAQHARAEAATRRELHALEAEIIELWRRWQVRQTRQAPSAASPSLSLLAIQPHLSPEEAVIQYVVVDDQISAFVVRRDGFTFLPNLATVPDVARLVEAWRFTLDMVRLYPADALRSHMAAWCADAQAHLGRLYRLIFAPLAPLLAGAERLRVVLYPTLPVIPFAALYDGARYLVERFEITGLPVAATMSVGRPTPSALNGRPVVVGYANAGRLPYAVAEAAQVAATLRAWSPVLLIGDAANGRALHAHLPTCPLLHLATHATFRADNPFLSWIRLADARLTVADLYDLTLAGRPLIVLSACETGLLGQRGGGLIGLSRAFLAAGASALVVSLWKVDDATTADLMAVFYEAYVSGAPPAEALRRAQRAVLAAHPHPLYWAPFVFIGA